MSELEFFKFLFDKKTRNDIKDIFESFKDTPEWEKNIITIRHNFTHDDHVNIDVFINFIENILFEKDWNSTDISKIKFVCLELINNAFKHAINKNKLNFSLLLKISKQSFSIKIKDNGKGFDLKFELAEQLSKPKGLTFSNRLANSLIQSNKNTIIALFTKNIGNVIFRGIDSTKLVTIDSLNIFVFNGKLNTYCSQNIKEYVIDMSKEILDNTNLILDLSNVLFIDSSGMSTLLAINRIYFERMKKIVIVITDNKSLTELFKLLALDKVLTIKENYDETLSFLGYPDFVLPSILDQINIQITSNI